MKFRALIYVAILISLLASIASISALAADAPTTMWVQRARLAYTGRSSHGPDAITAYIHVRDETLAMVTNAQVKVEWTLPDGTIIQEAAPTGFQGIAEFSLWVGRGTYKVCVLDIVKEGWLYNPALDRESCPVFTTP
jgi:hypothetical protein